MLNWKKKLSSLVPGEARTHLQNALTVEWSGHKTVLVEVPQARPKNEDVELSPFEGSGHEYGRLMDEDDEDDDVAKESSKKFVRARLGRGRSSTLQGAGSTTAGGSSRSMSSQSMPSHVRSESTPTYSRSTTRRYTPPRPEEDLLEGDIFAGPTPAEPRRPNPFSNPFSHTDDYASHFPSPPSRNPYSTAPARPNRPLIDPSDWDDVDIVKSPTSSTGSGSATSSAVSRPSKHDPFYSDRRW